MSTLLVVLLLYPGIGLCIALAMLVQRPFDRLVLDLGARAGLGPAWARGLWLGGTMLAWPLGLYVLATGRLVLTGNGTRD